MVASTKVLEVISIIGTDLNIGRVRDVGSSLDESIPVYYFTGLSNSTSVSVLKDLEEFANNNGVEFFQIAHTLINKEQAMRIVRGRLSELR